MESLILSAAAVVLALFVYGLGRAWRNMLRDSGTPPLMMLEHGATLAKMQDELGPGVAALALRRCTFCSAADLCAQRAARGKPVPDYCPNAALIVRPYELRAPR